MVGYQKVAEMYGMKDTRALRKWVKQYQDYGEDKNQYSLYKVSLIEYLNAY